MICEDYSFVALTTPDLERARRFWVEQLAFSVTEEVADRSLLLAAATLRLSLETADGDSRRAGSTDPVLAFRVASLEDTLADLETRDLFAYRGPTSMPGGRCAELRDPDGRIVLLVEPA